MPQFKAVLGVTVHAEQNAVVVTLPARDDIDRPTARHQPRVHAGIGNMSNCRIEHSVVSSAPKKWSTIWTTSLICPTRPTYL